MKLVNPIGIWEQQASSKPTKSVFPFRNLVIVWTK